jgi:hypothetical protein
LADTANTCEVSLTSSLSEGFRQDDLEKGSKDLKFFSTRWQVDKRHCRVLIFPVINKFRGVKPGNPDPESEPWLRKWTLWLAPEALLSLSA